MTTTKSQSVSTVADQKSVLTVWRNPNPVTCMTNAAKCYNHLLLLFNEKQDELNGIVREMRKYAELMNRETTELAKHVKSV